MGKVTFDQAKAMEKIQQKLDTGLIAAADEVVVLAQAEAPVRTGYLRDHIKRVEGVSVDGTRRAVTVRSEARYSVFQELGTYAHPAHPFFMQAYKQVQQNLVEHLSKGLKAKRGKR